MSTQGLIEQRGKIQFHSDLAYGKIAKYISTTITVPATDEVTETFDHDYPTPPLFVGWCTIGDAHWIPVKDVNMYSFDELGYNMEIFQFSTTTQYGFHVINDSGSERNIIIRGWLYFV